MFQRIITIAINVLAITLLLIAFLSFGYLLLSNHPV